MKIFFLIATMILASVSARADHIPEFTGLNPITKFQFDASPKRYADIIKIALLLEEYHQETGAYPIVDAGGAEDTAVYQVVALGQPEAIAHIDANGTPFGFALRRFDPKLLIESLERGLNRDISLPIDPQKLGTRFSPTYFVFLRHETDNTPAHYVILGTFGHPVERSTQVADGVHIVGISNLADLNFMVPLIGLDDFGTETITHILAQGAAADIAFSHVNTSID